MPSEGVAGFSTYSQLQEHIKTIHPPECRVCGMVCSSQRELKSHVEVRHGTLSVEDRKSFVCQEPGCRRAFTKKGNLNVHIESTHKAKKYVCGEVPPKSLNNVEGWDGVNACGRALSTKGSLQNHIRTTHLGMGRRRRKPAGKSRDDSSNDHSNTSNLMKLTGAGYDDDSRRHIDCLFPQCNFRFVRDYDLQIHLLSRHGLTEADAETFVTGTKGEIGPMSASSSAFPEDLMQEIISKNQDAVDIQGHEDIDDALFTGEGRFWIGDGLHDTDARGDDEWVRDEREMRAVIEDGTGAHEQDETMIDPILL
ncbi:MAG: hypothetical protein L6R40_004939 [Gallowayella cf. fulva]|nr:MAG: hypothetical protein L6R40_004939 [Xanthomendoza cf. fulva]